MSTTILIHGFHLQAKGWHQVVWGDPSNGVLGRVPKGIQEARKWNASTIVFSTGASEKGGVKEGEYTYGYAMDRIGELSDLLQMGPEALTDWLARRSVLDLTSQDTKTEVLACARVAKDRGDTTIVLVSCRSHIIRCLKEAISVLEKEPALVHFLNNLYATAADTTYHATTVDDIVVLEPPHRSDRPDAPIYKNALRINELRKDPERAALFNKELGTLLERYGA
jgi:hypothetical protein